MWINPRLTSKLAESYANGSMNNAFNGNNYLSNGFNNYNGNNTWVQNQSIGENTIHNYNGNPDGLTQQMRFNEIANQVLDQQREFERQTSKDEKINKNLIDFANSLSHPFNNRTYELPQQMMQPMVQNTNQPMIPMSDQLMNSQPMIQNTNQAMMNDRLINTQQNKNHLFSPISQTINQKNMTSILVIICVIVFISFLFIQLYMNQKRLEYMITLYRDIPINSPSYIMQKADNQYEH